MSWNQPQQQRPQQAAGVPVASGWGRPPSPLTSVNSAGADFSTPTSGFSSTSSAFGAPATTNWSAPQNPRQSSGSFSAASGSNWGQPPYAAPRAPAPVNRARSNSDLPKPSWDSIPGWSTSSTPSSTTGNGWGAQPPSSTSTNGWPSAPTGPAVGRSEGVVGGWSSRAAGASVDSWSRPVTSTQSNQQLLTSDGWGRPPSGASIESVNNWNRPAQQQSLQDGWGKPNPPASTSNWNTPSTWNNQSQSAVQSSVSGWGSSDPVAPARPGTDWAAAPRPTESALHSRPGADWAAPRGSSVEPALPNRTVTDWGQPRPSGGLEQNGWNSPSRQNVEPAFSGPERFGALGAKFPVSGLGDEDGRREIRKSRSSIQFERPAAPQIRQPTGPPPSVLAAALNPPAKKEEAQNSGAAPNPSMRLFNRSFNEVNKSLGLGGDDVNLRRGNRRGDDLGGDLSKAIGLYIYGITKGVRVQDILQVFSKFGDITNVGIVTKQNREGRIYAYVDYETVGSAAKAISAVEGKLFFDMKEPLELRPHFDRKPPVESDEAPTSVPKKEKEGVASDSSKKDLGGKKQPSSGPSKENTAPSSATTDRSEEALNKRTLHIANVPQQVDKSELEKLFHPFGEIRRIHIVQRPKEKRAFAFISFKTEESAAKAISSVKDGKHLGMTEPLKIEFSKADQLKDKDNTREKEKEKDTSGSGKADKAGGPSGKAGAKERPTDQPWKKGADLAKLLEKTATPATAPGTASTRSAAATSASSTASRKGSGGRTTIFIRDVPQNVTTEELKAKFNTVGPLRSFFIVDKLGPESGKCAVIAFEKGDDAARAVKEKIENALFPRQRRLTILGLPADVQEAPLKAHLAESGEVRRVELKPSEGNAAMGAEAEFARGDVAIVVFARLLSSGYKGQTVKVGYSPSSSGKAGVGADGNPVNGSDLKDDGNDSGDEADHEGERSDSRRGSEASVPGEHQTVSPAPQSSQTVLPPAGSEVQDDVSTSGDETDDEVGEVAFINSSGKTPTVTVSEAPSSSAAAPKEE